ncbi:MAG: ion channel [Chloroflexi bacterium]|nr:ion channel [Chloroflexota bacterium]
MQVIRATDKQVRRLLNTARNDDLREKWERRTEPALLILAVAMIPLLVGHFDPSLSESAQRWLFVGDTAIWIVFAVDLAVRVWLAEHRRRFLISHWYEVPIVVIPFFRPLRILLLLRLGAVRGVFSEILRRRAISVSLFASLFALALATMIVVLAERSGDGPIDDWGTALWWALATITTVGYGDVTPVTALGRAIGVLLMVAGIGVFGVLTANVAAWFVEGQQAQEPSDDSRIDQLEKENERLRAELEELQAQRGQDG